MTTAEVVTFAQVDGSRIRILDAPQLAPGVCAICGSSRNDDRKYVDLGIDVDYIGVMYFCTFCMTELANRLGCLTQEQSATLVAEVEAARNTILEFHATKVAYDNAISTLRDTGLFDGVSLVSTPPEQIPVADVSRAEQKPAGTSKSSKQSNPKQGSSGIPTDGDDDFLKLL